MAIIGNRVTDDGDVIFIKSDVPAIGLLTLTGFVDDTTNENPPTVFFDKTFRYSKDGITWTSWLPLTIPNITGITITSYDVFFVEYRYKRVGGGITELLFNSNTITATYTPLSCGVNFTNSIFSQYFGCNDIELLGWYINVTEKLYKTGVLANYLPRFNEEDSPETFIIFWKSISKFFAYYVIYARKFQGFFQNENLLREYLEQRGLKTSINNSLVELNQLMSGYLHEISKRGTINIYKEAHDDEVDGELLRLIFYKITDEFLFNLYRPQHFGWNLGNCSPLYRGLALNENINKSWEQNIIVDKNKYPLINPSNINVVDETLEIDGTSLESGIGFGGVEDDFFPIKVSNDLDYEISFIVRKTSATGVINLSLNSFNQNQIATTSLSKKTGLSSSIFVQNLNLEQDQDVQIKCLLFRRNSDVNFQDVLNIGSGNNLMMIDDTNYILPNITIDNGEMILYDIKIHPIYTEYSRGFLDVKNFISCWVKNNNFQYSILQLEDYIRRYLIPYNSNIKLTDLISLPIEEDEEEDDS